MSALEAVRALAPAVAARSAEIEAARRLPADLAHDLAEAGLFRIALARSLGGQELPPADIVEALEAMAHADASVGWCLMIGATSMATLSWMPHDAAADLTRDRLAIFGGAYAPSGRARRDGDHYVVSGRWAWGSGSANCAWLMAGCLVMEGDAPVSLPGGRPDVRLMFLPREAVELIDTWHAAGLKGTGSGDIRVTEALVPVTHSVSLAGSGPVEEGALYRFPVFGLLALGIAAAASGNARAALDSLVAGLGSRRPQGSSRSAAERATVQSEVAQADARLSAARALMAEAVDAAWAEAMHGPVPLLLRARLRLAATHLTRTAADVTRIAYDLGGGAALYLENPLQRRFRDAHAMTQHVMVQPQTYELAGRVLLGLPTDGSSL